MRSVRRHADEDSPTPRASGRPRSALRKAVQTILLDFLRTRLGKIVVLIGIFLTLNSVINLVEVTYPSVFFLNFLSCVSFHLPSRFKTMLTGSLWSVILTFLCFRLPIP